MAHFSKKIQNFLKTNVGGKSEQNARVARVPQSASYLQPGDFIIFNYFLPPTTPKNLKKTMQERIGLIVSNNSGNGVFVAPTGNKLVSCFTLLGLSQEIVGILFDQLYKKRRAANYYKVIGSLKSILGKDRYRTYKINKLSNIYDINLDLKPHG